MLWFLLFSGILACTKDEPMTDQGFGVERGKSFFILNEGAFGQGNSSVCLMEARLLQDCRIYEQASGGVPLGDVLNGGHIDQDFLYLVVNGSGRVVRLSLPGLEPQGSVEQLASPRHILPANADKAYVSDIYGGVIHILDLNAFVKTGEIPFPGWSEKMALAEGGVWVSNPELFGGPETQRIYKIDIVTDQITDSILVGRNPQDLVYRDGELFVLSAGSPGTADSAVLSRIRLSDKTLQESWNLPAAFYSKLAISPDGKKLAIQLDNVAVLDLETGELNSMDLLNQEIGVAYSIAFDERTTGKLWVTDAVDFISDGRAVQWDLESDQRSALLNVGISPNGVLFYP